MNILFEWIDKYLIISTNLNANFFFKFLMCVIKYAFVGCVMKYDNFK